MGNIFFKRFREVPGDINNLLDGARNGNREAREKLIEKHQRFVEKTVAHHTGAYSNVKSRDEYSIGLMAFNEAIDKFDPAYNRAFLSFATEVIKKRIIDYYRSNKGEVNCTPLSSFEGSEELCYRLGPPASPDPVGERVEREADLQSFLAALKEFKIGLDDLVKNTPKHLDSRLLSIKIARLITGDPELLTVFRQKKAIPLKKLLVKASVNPKTVERHRKYIIAICLVLTSNLETLKDYIVQTEKGGGGSVL